MLDATAHANRGPAPGAVPGGAPLQGQKRCRCGSATHLRSSHKDCPLYTPCLRLTIQPPAPVREEEEDQPELVQQRRTNVTSLESIVRIPALAPVIEDAVVRCFRINFEGSRAALRYVYHRLDANLAMPRLTLAQGGVLRQLFAGVLAAGGGHRNEGTDLDVNAFFNNVYVQNRPNNMAWTDGTRLSQLVTNMARQYETNAMNHVVLHMQSKVKLYLTEKVFKHLRALFESHGALGSIHLVVDHLNEVFSSPVGVPTVIQLDQEVLRQIPPADHFFLLGAISYIEGRIRATVLPHGRSLHKQDIQHAWWEYVPFLYRLLRNVIKYNNRTEDERLDAGRRHYRRKLFSLLPLSSFTMNHIHVDTDALYFLLRSLPAPARPQNFPAGPVQFRQNALQWWSQTFKIDSITSAGRPFSFFLSTNGKQASVHVSVFRPRATVDNWGYTIDEPRDYQPYNIAPGTRVIALDPGRDNLFVACYGPGRGDIIRYSNERWQEESGNRSQLRKHKDWMAEDPHFRTLIYGTPSACCDDGAELDQHLTHVLELLDEITDFYSDMRWRRLKWKTRIKRQRAYDGIYNLLAAGNPDPVIAYGGGKFNHASRGYAPTPNKHLFVELKRRCRTRLVNEAYSSRVCSGCNQLMIDTRHWGIKHCIGCGVIWNRDVNAARNIREIFLDQQLNNGQRPLRFTRGVHR